VEQPFTVVGSAMNGLETVRLMEQHKPNVLILDLMMPGLNGLEVLKRVPDISPQTRVLILSMHGDESYMLEAFRSGATGYMTKDSMPAQLVEAVRQVAAGQRYLGGSLSEEQIESYLKKIQNSHLDSSGIK